MENKVKYDSAFIVTFNVQKNDINTLSYQSIQEWDSVGHMNLISAIEDAFDVMLETDDIVDFSSYLKGIEILEKNGIKF